MAYSKNQVKGNIAEREAEQLLARAGLTLIERNYRHKTGEIDLIMQDGDSLVFVEVRSRKKDDHGSAQESVTPSKQQKIIRTAKLYLQEANLYNKVTSRFDVVTFDPIDGEWQSAWFKNAFTVNGYC